MRIRALLLLVPMLLLAPAAGGALAVPGATASDVPVAPGKSAAVVVPVPGPVVGVFVPPTSPYGPGHRGVDLAAEPGEAVVAAMAGTVSFAGRVAGAGWVTVDHGGGLDTTYGVLGLHAVSPGDRVRAGQVIGWLAGDRDHLDWGARLDGAYIDPLSLLGRWQVHLVDPTRAPPPLVAPAFDGTGLVASALAGTGQGMGSSAPVRLAWPWRGHVTSGFGPRRHPLTGGVRLHAGIDLAAPLGAPVAAPAGGTVLVAGRRGGYGLTVVVDHGAGLVTLSAHLSSVTVTVGQRVATGELVGRAGATGAVTGPHLHFEVRLRGAAQDPLRWLPR